MKDAIKDLDAALTGDGDTSSFEKEYPDAPQWAVEAAEQVAENNKRLNRVERERKHRKEAAIDALGRRVKEVKSRIAAMAAQAGIATEEEKRLIKSAREADKQSGLDDSQKFFIPSSERERYLEE